MMIQPSCRIPFWRGTGSRRFSMELLTELRTYRSPAELTASNSWHTKKKAFRLVSKNTRRAEKDLTHSGGRICLLGLSNNLYKKYRIIQTQKRAP